MHAEIRYAMQYRCHPWDPDKKHVELWCLMEQVVIDGAVARETPIAIFNFDSEAIRFMRACHQGERLVLPLDVQELFQMEGENRVKHR